jgi:DNA-binding MarR family transcriptional regulator
MPDTIKLTLRQKVFLMRLVEFFGYSRKPVHHTELAKALGLSNSTTYDMLKLLESKGVLYPIFAMPKNESERHGRSRIMFVPTEKIVEEVYQPLGGKTADREELRKYVIRIMERLGKEGVYAGDIDDLYGIFSVVAKEEPSLAPRDGLQQEQDELKELKNHMISTIERQPKYDYARLVHELSVLMADTSSPLARCAEVILAILLYIRAAKYKLDSLNPLQMLLAAPVTKERMSMLVGLVWGLVLSNPNPKTRRLAVDLDRTVQDYEESISKLSQEELVRLHDFTKEIWDYLSSTSKAVK